MSRLSIRGILARLKARLESWRQQFREYSQKCLESGYVPLAFPWVQFITRQLARILVFIQLGRVRIIGKENLKHTGRFIFCPNHSAMFDAPVLYSFMKRGGLRYMTAYEEMRGFGGLKAVIMGAMGCFPVDRTRGGSVIEPAVKILLDGASLVIFPEGKISATGECLPFKKGPAIILEKARQKHIETGGPNAANTRFAIVPMSILYHRRDVATATKDFGTMGLKWRGGVTVHIGKPIWLDELPNADPDYIMNLAHKFVCQAQSEAKALGCPCDNE